MGEQAETTDAAFAPGDTLFREGEPASRIYIVRKGRVKLMRRIFRESFVVEVLGSGNVCGEIAVTPGQRYTVTAVAIDDVETTIVDGESLDAVLADSPELGRRFIRRLSRRIRQTQYRSASMAIRSTLGRVMLQLHNESRRQVGQGDEAFVAIPYDLPDVFATERGAVDRALHTLIEERLIEIDGQGRFRIIDRDAFDRRLHYLELRDRFED